MNEEVQLHGIVDAAHRNLTVAAMIRKYVKPALLKLGWSEDDADTFIELSLIGADYDPDLARWESRLQIAMPMPAMTNMGPCMVERASLTYGKISPHILPGAVLDLGGGSGEIAARIAADGHEVAIADVRDWRREQSTRFVPIFSNKISVLDRSYDNVIALHVLHHSNDPETLLKEMFRVARKRVIFIESVTDTMVEWLYTCWFDWFYNRVMHYSADPKNKIPVPCRFFPAVGWEQMAYRLYRLNPTASEDLGIYQVLNPIHHRIYVFDK